jgi:hypothetical protein
MLLLPSDAGRRRGRRIALATPPGAECAQDMSPASRQRLPRLDARKEAVRPWADLLADGVLEPVRRDSRCATGRRAGTRTSGRG